MSITTTHTRAHTNTQTHVKTIKLAKFGRGKPTGRMSYASVKHKHTQNVTYRHKYVYVHIVWMHMYYVSTCEWVCVTNGLLFGLDTYCYCFSWSALQFKGRQWVPQTNKPTTTKREEMQGKHVIIIVGKNYHTGERKIIFHREST